MELQYSYLCGYILLHVSKDALFKVFPVNMENSWFLSSYQSGP